MGERRSHLNERGVLQYGWTSLHGLSVWVTTHSYSQYCQTLQLLGMQPRDSPLAVPVEVVRKAISRLNGHAQRDLFRVIQVFNHECAHYRTLCGTSAGAVTYALAAQRMQALRQSVSTIVRQRFQRNTVERFLPLDGIAIDSPVPRPAFTAQQTGAATARHDSDKALTFWISPIHSVASNDSGRRQFWTELPKAMQHVFSRNEMDCGEIEPQGDIDAESGLAFGHLVEAQARLFDFALLTVIANRKVRTALLEELCAHPDYVSAWEYTHQCCRQATFMDLALCLDLALMPPILRPTRGTSRPLKWHDIHPVLRFERAVKALPSLPRIGTSFTTDYTDVAKLICGTTEWPLPWAVLADVGERNATTRTRTDAAQRYMRNRLREAASLRSEDRSFFAWPWTGGNLACLGTLAPPMQFWRDGLTWGVRLPLAEAYGLMKVAFADAITADCMTARAPRAFFALWRRMSHGLAAEFSRRADKGIFNETVDKEFSCLPDRVCEEMFGIPLGRLVKCWA